MTRTAHVPAREPVSHILREAARLEVQREALSSKSALQNDAIAGSLIPCLSTREPDGRGIAPGADITLRAGHAAARHREPDPPDRCLAVSACLSRTRALGCTAVYGFGRLPASLGRASQYDEPARNMGNYAPCQSRAEANCGSCGVRVVGDVARGIYATTTDQRAAGLRVEAKMTGKTPRIGAWDGQGRHEVGGDDRGGEFEKSLYGSTGVAVGKPTGRPEVHAGRGDGLRRNSTEAKPAWARAARRLGTTQPAFARLEGGASATVVRYPVPPCRSAWPTTDAGPEVNQRPRGARRPKPSNRSVGRPLPDAGD